jgi:hypothetical protein
MLRVVSLLLAFWFFSANPALAAKWLAITRTEDSSIFLDAESVRRDGAHMRAWFLWDYANVKEMEGPAHQAYVSVKSVSLFDCRKKQRAVVEAFYYAQRLGVGRPVGKAIMPARKITFDDVIPGTVGELMLNAVCEPNHRGERQFSQSREL